MIVHKKCLSHGSWVSQTCGFDDDAIKLQATGLDPRRKFLQNLHEVLANSTAYAAVHHLNYLLLNVFFRVRC